MNPQITSILNQKYNLNYEDYKNVKLSDLPLSSMDVLDLIFEFEELLDVRIDIEAIEMSSTLEEFIKLQIENKT